MKLIETGYQELLINRKPEVLRQLAYADLEEHQKHVSGLKQYMIHRLEATVPGVTFNGDSKSEDSLYTVLNVTFPANDNHDMLLFLLDLEGVACSGGSACSSGATRTGA